MRDYVKAVAVSAFVIIMLCLCMASCTTERSFVKYHDKCVSSKDTSKSMKPLKWFKAWYPFNPTTKTVIKTVNGKPDTVTLAGETVYADCSTAVISALDEASKKHVAVKCPPSKIIHVKDIVYVKDSTVGETPDYKLIVMRYGVITADLSKQTDETNKYKASTSNWRGRALWTWTSLLLIAIFIVGFKYFKFW